MSSSGIVALVWAPYVTFFSASSLSHRSTMFTNEPELGVKCR